jgi:hypothetical protein
VSVAAAVDELVDALEAAGLRVAVRDGDITPPCVYVRIGTVTEAGAPLSGGQVTLFYVYLIPIRGVDNLAGDADALDSVYAALSPLAWAEIVTTATSVTVRNDTWPCYRLDVSLAGLSGASLGKVSYADRS